MESFRLKSTLVENEKEYIIQTANDVNVGSVLSTVYVDGHAADTLTFPHSQEIEPEEVLSLVKLTHEEQKHEIETLLEAYRKAQSSHDADMIYHLGTAFFYKRLFREARDLFHNTIEINPGNHQAQKYLSTSLLMLNMAPEAIAAGREAVKLRPTYADYHNTLGEAYLAVSQPVEAVREFEEAIRINLYYGDAYFNLGLAYLQRAIATEGDQPLADLPTKALNCIKKASLIYTEYDSDLLDQGMNAIQVMDLRQALPTLLRAREAKKEKHRREFAAFHMRFLLHSDWISEEAILQRIKFLNSEIRKHPGYVDLYSELARCQLEHARVSWRKGLDNYRKSLELNPAQSDVEHLLGGAEQQYERMREMLNQIGDKI